MSKTNSRLLLITANVGSIFEDPDRMLGVWLREFLSVVKQAEPELLAIHCQEVGGKNYEESMQHVNKFITMLLDSKEMEQFDRARIFLDEDFTAVEKFTALGSLYFIHRSVRLIEIFDFHSSQFVPVEGKELLTGNIEHISTKEKAKFAKEFFPDFVWSRKGFIRTRWNLYNTKFDLVNIHLIHDVSNVSAMETSPSTYSKFRERALLHTIERFETDQYEKYPFFIFGDFNFRMDTCQLVKDLMSATEQQHITGKKNEISKILFKQTDNGNVLLTVGKKDFNHLNHNQLFSSGNAMKLQKFDNEPEACRDKLFEFDVTFPPSYPFSEDATDGTSYMPTRCPGWCDRIMMTHDAKALIENIESVEYRMIGTHICMGDHKPIYLSLRIRNPPMTLSSTGNAIHSIINNQSHLTNNDLVTSADALPNTSEDVPDIISDRVCARTIRPVISINGEEIEATSVGEINIHDYTTFEQEDIITERFFEGIKRRAGMADRRGGVAVPEGSGVSRMSGKQRFKGAVSALVKSDSVLRALKHYTHRSDSETDDTDSTADDVSPLPSSNTLEDWTAAKSIEDWTTDKCDDSVLAHSVNPEVPCGLKLENVSKLEDGSSPNQVEFAIAGNGPEPASANGYELKDRTDLGKPEDSMAGNSYSVDRSPAVSSEQLHTVSGAINEGSNDSANVNVNNNAARSSGVKLTAKVLESSTTECNTKNVQDNKILPEQATNVAGKQSDANNLGKEKGDKIKNESEGKTKAADIQLNNACSHSSKVEDVVIVSCEEKHRLIDNTHPSITKTTTSPSPKNSNTTSAAGKDMATQRLIENSDSGNTRGSSSGRNTEGSKSRQQQRRLCGCCKTQ